MPIGLSRLIREGVIPLVVVYAVFLVLLVRAAGARAARPANAGRAIHLLATATAGCIVFLAIVAVFELGLGARGWAYLGRAAAGGAILAYGVAVPVFLGVAWALERRRRRRSRSLGTGS